MSTQLVHCEGENIVNYIITCKWICSYDLTPGIKLETRKQLSDIELGMNQASILQGPFFLLDALHSQWLSLCRCHKSQATWYHPNGILCTHGRILIDTWIESRYIHNIAHNVPNMNKVWGLPSSITHLNRTPIFEWYVVLCGSKKGYHKDTCLLKDWIACSNYNTQSRSNSQLYLKGLYNHLMSTRIFTLIMNKMFVWDPKREWGKQLWPQVGLANHL